jgi:hypothetical protein
LGRSRQFAARRSFWVQKRLKKAQKAVFDRGGQGFCGGPGNSPLGILARKGLGGGLRGFWGVLGGFRGF